VTYARQCCGSASESFGWIRIGKKSLDSDTDSDTVVESKIADQTLDIEKKIFSIGKFFPLTYRFRTHMKAIRGTIWTNLGPKY
jgi:hypothetical protein